MDVKKLIVIKDKEQFEAKLAEELNEDPEALPLERGCNEGGWPEPSSVDVYDVEKTGEDDETIVATFSVSFDEELNTSCGNVTVSKHRYMDCTVQIDKVMEKAEFTVYEVEYESEF